ncbi:MAG: murein biosynthesis integral membrane protein MurJ [Phycisphaeraceae bacterium]|nr:murein biosynthesis integral membrane protein MurJ [Phycisphaeraceae bacterium]
MNGRRLWPLRLLLGLYWVALATASHWPNLRLQWPESMDGVASGSLTEVVGLDKLAHLGAFAVLTWLALKARLFPTRPRGATLTVLLVVIYSALDEWTQQWTAREVHLNDWLASVMGVCLGILGWGLTDWLSGSDGSFAGQTKVVSALTTLSRLFGLLRDWALALAFGLSGLMDAFIVAFMVPNLFRRLFGEGALAAAFMPCYSRLKEQDPASAIHFAWKILKRLLIGLGLFVAALVIALAAVQWWVDLPPRSDLTVNLSLVLLWFAPLICATAIAGAVLQAHGRFGPPAAAPIVLNVAMIAAALYAAHRMGHHSALSRTGLVAVAVLAAGVVQLIWHLTLLPSRQPAVSADRVREAGTALRKAWAPTLVGMAVFQLNVLADALIAMGFSAEPGATLTLFGGERPYPMQVGDVGALSLAQRLYQFPLGVFGIAIATTIFPALASAASDKGRFAMLLRQGLRLTVFIGLPASVGLWLVREPLTHVIFYPGSGALEEGDAGRIGRILAFYAPSVWAYSMTHVLTRSFYAQDNPRTPMRVAVIVVGLNLTLNLILIWFLGAAGLAASTSFCSMIHGLVLLGLVRRYVEKPVDRQVAGSWFKIAMLSVVMGAVVGGLVTAFDVRELSRAGAALLLGGLSLAGALVIFIGSKGLSMAEPRWLLRGSGP